MSQKTAQEKKDIPFYLRTAKLTDAPAILKVYKQAWMESYPNAEYNIKEEDIEREVANFKLKDWQDRLEKTKNSQTFLAIFEDEIVGFCTAIKGIDENKIEFTYVLKGHQDKGIGSKLFKEALDYLQENKKITTSAVTYSKKAHEFYESFGFKKVGIKPFIERNRLITGKIIPEFNFEKTPVNFQSLES